MTQETHEFTEVPTQGYEIADLFCGAGGWSTGAAQAVSQHGGKMKLYAVNHWPVAVRTHELNHPDAEHFIQDLELADPETLVPKGYLDILIASPECRFYSRARGGKPTLDQGRMNPWIIQRWLTSLNVRILLVENVPEFREWGPLQEDRRPDRSRKGLYFQQWIRSIQGLGYRAEWRMLNAADYGDATTRTRFFLMARNDGKPIRWPEPSHSKTGGTPMLGTMPRWRGAKEIIDWSNPGRSLLDDPKYRKKPLSPKTRARIAKGLAKYGGPLAHLYIRLLDLPDTGKLPGVQTPRPEEDTGPLQGPLDGPFHGSDRQHTVPRGAGDPVHTVTTLTGGGLYVVHPVAEPFVGANRNNCAPKDTEQPVPSATTAHGGGNYLVRAEISPFMLGQQSGGAPRDAQEPVPTIATDGAVSLVRPTIIQYYGQSDAQDVAQPVSAILSNRKHALANPTLVQYFGTSDSSDVEKPVPGLTTKGRYGLANPTLLEVNHTDSVAGEGHRVHSTDDPVRAITTKRHTALAEPVLLQTGQDGEHVDSVDQPLPSLGLKNDLALANPGMSPLDETTGGPDGEPTGEPFGESPRGSRGGDGVDPRRLVYIDGKPWLLDIRFRMLQNGELARAMGFEDEETKYEFVGNITEVTKQIGNAVPVGLAAALVGAVLSSDDAPQEAQEAQEVQQDNPPAV